MKNNEQKPAKSARKAAANDIEQGLLKTLKDAADKLGQNSKELVKEIEKSSKKLAKKISKQLEFAKPAKEEKESTPKAEKVKAPAKAKVKADTAPAKKAKKATAVKPAAKIKTVKVKEVKAEVDEPAEKLSDLSETPN